LVLGWKTWLQSDKYCPPADVSRAWGKQRATCALYPDKVNCRCYNRRVEISLISGPPGSADTQTPENGLEEAQQRLRRMVLDSVPAAAEH
jgi:hypothetical protein